MGRNTEILTGQDEDASCLDLTLMSPSEHRRYADGEPVRALLTARGKDHEMSIEQLERLGNTCLKYVKLMREKY